MSKIKNVLIGASERYAAEHGISAEKVQDLILSGEVFGDKDLEWIADYAAGKEEKKLYRSYSSMSSLTDVKKRADELQYVVALSRETADKWLTELKEQIRKYGYVRVATLYELTANGDSFNFVKPLFPDFDYGWTKEEDIHFVRNRDGYWFNLPKPVKLSDVKDTVTVYLVLNRDCKPSKPEVVDMDSDWSCACDKAYQAAKRLMDECDKKYHHPLLKKINPISNLDGYVVYDDVDNIEALFYVVRKEVEV